jgi:hypothetical protein
MRVKLGESPGCRFEPLFGLKRSTVNPLKIREFRAFSRDRAVT